MEIYLLEPKQRFVRFLFYFFHSADHIVPKNVNNSEVGFPLFCRLFSSL